MAGTLHADWRRLETCQLGAALVMLWASRGAALPWYSSDDHSRRMPLAPVPAGASSFQPDTLVAEVAGAAVVLSPVAALR
jgi:hypothetical protein